MFQIMYCITKNETFEDFETLNIPLDIVKCPSLSFENVILSTCKLICKCKNRVVILPKFNCNVAQRSQI
jgi:hypothetical protein